MSRFLPNPFQSPSKSTFFGRIRAAAGKIGLLLRNAAPQCSDSWRRLIPAALRGKATRRLDRRPSGLTDACDDGSEQRANADAASASCGRVLHRTTSFCSESAGSGLDRKPDVFLANFCRLMQSDKRISLELSYCRGYGFGSCSGSDCSFGSST